MTRSTTRGIVTTRSPALAGRMLGTLRAFIGISALFAPGAVSAPWVGLQESRRASVRLFARTLGGRDLALGVGTLFAHNKHGALRSWILLGALADTCDVGATIASFSRLPKISRWLILALTGGAAFAGMAIGFAIVPENGPGT